MEWRTGLRIGTEDNCIPRADMVDDGIAVLNSFEIKKVRIIGISMGGMIDQELTMDHTDKVDRPNLDYVFMIYSQRQTIYLRRFNKTKIMAFCLEKLCKYNYVFEGLESILKNRLLY